MALIVGLRDIAEKNLRTHKATNCKQATGELEETKSAGPCVSANLRPRRLEAISEGRRRLGAILEGRRKPFWRPLRTMRQFFGDLRSIFDNARFGGFSSAMSG